MGKMSDKLHDIALDAKIKVGEIGIDLPYLPIMYKIDKKAKKYKREQERKAEEEQAQKERDEREKREREEKQREIIKQKEAVQKLLNELFEVSPFDDIIPIGFRSIKVDRKKENISSWDYLQEIKGKKSNQERCLTLIEVVDSGGRKYYLTEKKIEAPKDYPYWKLPAICYFPDSLLILEKVLNKIVPKFADVKIVLESSDSIMKVFETNRSFSYDRSLEKESLIGESEIIQLSNRTLKSCLEICQEWENNNYAVRFGREGYDFWKGEMINLGTKFSDEKRKRDTKSAAFEAAQKESAICEAGKKGENEVEYALKWLPSEFYVVEKREEGIFLKCEEISDEVQEFDHIVVSPKGVFLIETKNYAGKIVIDEQGNWIRHKLDGSIVGEENPLQQIQRHHRIIEGILGDIAIYDVICIANNKTIIEGASNSLVPVIKSDMISYYLSNFKKNDEKIYCEAKMKNIQLKIEEHRYKI